MTKETDKVEKPFLNFIYLKIIQKNKKMDEDDFFQLFVVYELRKRTAKNI